MKNKLFVVIGLVVVFSMLMAACQPAAVVTPTVEPTAVPTEVPAPRTLVICMGQEPDTLYPLGGSMLAMSSVLEAVFDGPVDAKSFSYQPVILEKLPSIADGDAVLAPVTVTAGDEVVDNDGNVAALAAGMMYRPSGCNSADCAVEYTDGEVQMDQLAVTFKLLPDLKWSDGTALTTKDSVYSFNLQADPDTPTVKYALERTATYEAADDVTITWTGLPGYMDATYYLNFYTPYPEHIWGQYTAAELLTAEASSRAPLGWGPYIIDEWVTGESITLHKNPGYFRAAEGLPVFDKLVYRIVGTDANADIAALLAGDCDIVDQTAGLDGQSELLISLQNVGEVDATFVTGTTWEHADFNIQPLEGAGFSATGAFADKRLRQSIAMCMDRQSVVDTVMFGQSIVLDTYLPPEHPLFNPNVKHYDYDVEAASALLDEIGWVDEDGDAATPRTYAGTDENIPAGTLLEFSFETTNSTMRQQATQILADSMALCGIKVNLAYYPSSEWFADGPDGKLFGRRTDLGVFAWLTGVEPACDLYTTENIPGDPEAVDEDGKLLYVYGWGGQNQTGYSNTEYDNVCNAARQALPGQEAYEMNHLKAQEIFGEDLPVVPLFLRLKLAATRPDMCNFIMDPTANSEMWNIENFDYGDCDK